jgi:hypothetical protein
MEHRKEGYNDGNARYGFSRTIRKESAGLFMQ